MEVKRDGYRWTQSFSLGDPDGPLERLEPSEETGTTVTFYASPDIFETTNLLLRHVGRAASAKWPSSTRA